MALFIRKHLIFHTKEEIDFLIYENGCYNPKEKCLEHLPGIKWMSVTDNSALVYFQNNNITFEIIPVNIQLRQLSYQDSKILLDHQEVVLEKNQRILVHVNSPPTPLRAYQIIICKEDQFKKIAATERIPLLKPSYILN